MRGKPDNITDIPSSLQLKTEIDRVKYKSRFLQLLRSTVYALVIVAAVAILVATIWMPVLQIYGTSMQPTLNEGDIVVTIKNADFESGDLVSFYLGNKLLVKRCIAGAGQLVDIDKDGNVYVDGKLLDEPYIPDKAFGECDIEFPYLVPEDRMFCLGDDRTVSADSRNSAVGCVAKEQIVGKIIFRVWPFSEFGKV